MYVNLQYLATLFIIMDILLLPIAIFISTPYGKRWLDEKF